MNLGSRVLLLYCTIGSGGLLFSQSIYMWYYYHSDHHHGFGWLEDRQRGSLPPRSNWTAVDRGWDGGKEGAWPTTTQLERRMDGTMVTITELNSLIRVPT